MATLHGYKGNVDWDSIVSSDSGTDYQIHSWSVDVTADAPDDTTFSTTGWRTFKNDGLRSWSGTVEVYVDDTNVIQPSDVNSQATLKLYVNSSNYYSGLAILTGAHPAASVDGIETQTLDFQGTSDLSYS